MDANKRVNTRKQVSQLVIGLNSTVFALHFGPAAIKPPAAIIDSVSAHKPVNRLLMVLPQLGYPV